MKKENHMMAARIALGDDGYPTDDALDAIKSWPNREYRELMASIRNIWRSASWGWDQDLTEDGPANYRISTGGWSGNESIVYALKSNMMFWLLCWVSSRRGGHYVFEVQRLHDGGTR